MNSRPHPYQGCALPLSYSSVTIVGRGAPRAPGRRALLSARPDNVKAKRMENKPATPSREERLAEKLRENLRRRKAQAKEQQVSLPKQPPKS